MKRNSSVVAQHLTSNILTDWCCSVELQKHVCLEQILCSFDIVFGYHCAKTHPFVLNIEKHIFAAHWITNEVDTPQACIFVASIERLEAVTQIYEEGEKIKRFLKKIK